MKKIIRILAAFIFVLFFLACCHDNGGGEEEGGYGEPIDLGEVSELTFSHNSGLYNKQFNLTLAAEEGSDIFYSTDGSIPLPDKAGNGYVFKYGSPIQVKNRNGQPNVLSASANTAQFYMAPDDRRGSVPYVYQPSKDQVLKATVIRYSCGFKRQAKRRCY